VRHVLTALTVRNPTVISGLRVSAAKTATWGVQNNEEKPQRSVRSGCRPHCCKKSSKVGAAGVAAHGARGREIMLALKAAGEGILDMPVAGEAKLRKSAAQLGISTEGKTREELAVEVADILLEDLSRTVPGEHKTLNAFATKERIEKCAS